VSPKSVKGKPVPGVAIVNEAFARVYFDGRSPVGQSVIVDSSSAAMEIVGLTADAVYHSVREDMHPAVFIPLESREGAALLIRTEDRSSDLSKALRLEVPKMVPGLQAAEALPLEELVSQQMVRERLLAALSTFFAMLAILLAIVGLYGVLNYAVTRERKEIGLRMALGARPAQVVGLITARLLALVSIGAVVGIAGGQVFGRAIGTLLFQIAPTAPVVLLVPIIALVTAAALAALPPAIRAVRIDPAQTIRNES
jgi:hypothetical protein